MGEAKTAETVASGGERAEKSRARPPIRLPARFEYLRTLGEGGMGTVVAARDSALDRVVAVKVVIDDSRPTAKARFAQEARSAAALDHPNIVTVHDVDERGGLIVMELAAGGSLANHLAEGNRLDSKEARELAGQLLSALAAAHDADIVHRDVKPANILLTSAGQIKLADFGIACIGESELTQTGAQVGTPLYMAPEQLRGGDAGVAADIYAAGATLFEATTGERLNQPNGTHPAPRQAVLDAVGDRVLADAIACATAERPSDRFATASAFIEALKATPRRRWFLPSLVVALAVACAAALVVHFASADGAEVEAPSAGDERQRRSVVAMLPFEGGETLYPGGALGLAELLGLQLAQTGYVEIIPVRRLVNHAGPNAKPPAWRAAAAKLDAEFSIRGQVEMDEDGAALVITIEDADGALVQRIPRRAEVGRATEQVRWSAREVLRAIRGEVEVPEKPRTEISDAVWADLSRGIHLLWAHEHEEAYHYLQSAVEKAPELGLARYYLAITLWWNARPDAEVIEQIETALTKGLDENQKATLQGLRLLVEQRYRESIATFRSAVENQPEDVTALYGLFESLFHGGSPREAIATYERLYEIYPQFNLGFQHAVGYYAAHGLVVKLRSELSRTGAYDDPEMRPWVTRGLFAERRYKDVILAISENETLPPSGAEDRSAKSLARELLVPALAVSGELERAAEENKKRSNMGLSGALAGLGLALSSGDAKREQAARQAVELHLRAASGRNLAAFLSTFAVAILPVASKLELRELRGRIETAISDRRRPPRGISVPLALIAGQLEDRAALVAFSKSEFFEAQAIARASLSRLDGNLTEARREAQAAIASASDGTFMIAERWLLAGIAREDGDDDLVESTCAEISVPRVFSWTWAGANNDCKRWLAARP